MVAEPAPTVVDEGKAETPEMEGREKKITLD